MDKNQNQAINRINAATGKQPAIKSALSSSKEVKPPVCE